MSDDAQSGAMPESYLRRFSLGLSFPLYRAVPLFDPTKEKHQENNTGRKITCHWLTGRHGVVGNLWLSGHGGCPQHPNGNRAHCGIGEGGVFSRQSQSARRFGYERTITLLMMRHLIILWHQSGIPANSLLCPPSIIICASAYATRL